MAKCGACILLAGMAILQCVQPPGGLFEGQGAWFSRACHLVSRGGAVTASRRGQCGRVDGSCMAPRQRGGYGFFCCDSCQRDQTGEYSTGGDKDAPSAAVVPAPEDSVGHADPPAQARLGTLRAAGAPLEAGQTEPQVGYGALSLLAQGPAIEVNSHGLSGGPSIERVFDLQRRRQLSLQRRCRGLLRLNSLVVWGTTVRLSAGCGANRLFAAKS